MPKIYFELQGELATRSPTQCAPSQIRQNYFSFEVPLNESPNVKVKVEIFPRFRMPESAETSALTTLVSAQVKSSCEHAVSDDLLSALNSGITTESGLPTRKLQVDLRRVYNEILNATSKTLLLIKYGLNLSDIEEPPFSGPETLLWGAKGSALKYISLTTNLRGFWEPDKVNLDNETEKQIQSYIDTGFSPFFALAPLHRAKNECDPRYIIIYAAYAAELAIKEFLIEYTKKEGYVPLEPLLLELPSPSIGTLYGAILKFYTGKGSPKTDEMVALNRARNALMHRPPQKEKEIEIDLVEAEKYVRDVEAAIFHLLYLLYDKTDPVIKQLYKTNTKTKKRSSNNKGATVGPITQIVSSGTFKVVKRQDPRQE
jgi:hypothetical protein